MNEWVEVKIRVPLLHQTYSSDHSGHYWCVLSGILSGTSTIKDKSGDNYFDIDIQVDEIANDYDVDQMAERIKQNIYEDSTYRNVNAINFLR